MMHAIFIVVALIALVVFGTYVISRLIEDPDKKE